MRRRASTGRILGAILVLIAATALLAAGQPLARLPGGEVVALGLEPTPAAEAWQHAVNQPMLYRDYGDPLPSSVDHSAFMPPVRSQGSAGSCASWAIGYYYKAFQEGKEQGWSFGSNDEIRSPAFLYNLINGGRNIGTSFGSNFGVLMRFGDCSWTQMPYSASDLTTWPSMAAWRDGMNSRADDYSLIYHSYMGSADDYIDEMKAHLASGDCFVMGIPVYSDFYSIGSFPQYVYDGPRSGASYVGGHGICIVGYDDNREGGAFKFVNSWGTGWGQGGYAWLSYDFVGDYAIEAWSMTDRIGYQPQAIAELHITHPLRYQLRVALKADTYTETIFWNRGGSVPNIDAFVDITEQIANLPPSPSVPWTLEVKDTYEGSSGQIDGFSIEYGAVTYVSDDPPVPVPDMGTGTASTDGGGGSENTPPTLAAVAITPDPAFTTSDLTANPSGWYDADGDSPGYRWLWERKPSGSSTWAIISGATESSLGHANFARGDGVRVTCTPWDGTDEGSPVTDEITISNSPPTQPTVDVTPDAPKTGDALSVSAGGSTDPDGDTVSYSYRWYRDGDLQSAYNDQTSVPASATAKGQTWRCVVTPSDGSVNGPAGDDQVTIGNSPPSVQAVAISPDPALAGNPLTATPSGWSDPDGDPAGYRWQWQRWSGSAWQDIAGATAATLDGASVTGGERIRVMCTPWDGAAEGAPVVDETTIGDAPPTVSIDAPADGASVSTRTVQVSGTADDDGAVDRVEVRVNSGEWFDATGTDTWSAPAGLQPGENLIEARSRDAAGQWSEIDAVAVTCVADFPPHTAITSHADGAGVCAAAVRIAGTASDDQGLQKVIVRVNGGAWFRATGTDLWSAWVNLHPGENVIQARAYDSAGQWGEIVTIALIGRGDLKSVTWISAPTNGATVYDAALRISGTAYDDQGLNKVIVRVNGGAWFRADGTESWSAWVNLQSGSNVIQARAYDSAGQWGNIVTITLIAQGNLRPVAKFTLPEDGAVVHNAAVPVTGTAVDDDGLDKVIVRVNGGAWYRATGTASWSAWAKLRPGENLVEARARDSTGLWGAIAARTIIAQGDLRPVTWITAPPDGASGRDASVLVSGTAWNDGGLEKVIVRVNGGAWYRATGTTSWSAWANLRSGPNLIEACAYDGAQWSEIVARTITGIGDLLPVVRITSPADGVTVAGDSIEISGVGYDDRALTKVIVCVNGGAWVRAHGTASWRKTVALAEGVNEIRVRGYDNAKHWGPIVSIMVTRTGGYALTLSSLTAQPGPLGADVVFALSAGGSVTAEVMNIAGRPVRTLVTDRAMPAGVNELWWDGRNASGLSVPSGTYLVRLTARDATGAQCSAMTTLQITR